MKKNIIFFLTLLLFLPNTFANSENNQILEDTCHLYGKKGDYICLATEDNYQFLVKNGKTKFKKLKNIQFDNFRQVLKVSADVEKIFYEGIDENNKRRFYINLDEIIGFEQIQDFQFLDNGDYLFNGYQDGVWKIVKNGKIIDTQGLILRASKNNYAYLKTSDEEVTIKNDNEQSTFHPYTINLNGNKKNINTLEDIISNSNKNLNILGSKFRILDFWIIDESNIGYLIIYNNYIYLIQDNKTYEVYSGFDNISTNKKLIYDISSYINYKKDFIFSGYDKEGNSCLAGYSNNNYFSKCFEKGQQFQNYQMFNSEVSYLVSDGEKSYVGIGKVSNGKIIFKNESIKFDSITWGDWSENGGLIYDSFGNIYYIGEKGDNSYLMKNNVEILSFPGIASSFRLASIGNGYMLLTYNNKLIKDGEKVFEGNVIKFGYENNSPDYFVEVEDSNKSILKKYSKNSVKDLSEYEYLIENFNGYSLILNKSGNQRNLIVLNPKSNDLTNKTKEINKNVNKTTQLNSSQKSLSDAVNKIKAKLTQKQKELVILRINKILETEKDKKKVEKLEMILLLLSL